MGNIITVYLAREILKTSGATIVVLFIIMLSNALGRVLADIAEGDIPQQALLPVLLGQSIGILSLLLPVGLFLGIVFAFGRMYKDHEIVVMQSCGVGYAQFYRPVVLVLLPLLLFSCYASLWLNAQVQRFAQQIVDETQSQHEFHQIRPGQFNQSKDSDLVFYMESISDDRLELRDIIISEYRPGSMVLETAHSGRQENDDNTGGLFLVVGPGERYEGIAGRNDYRLIQFEQHGILIENRNRARATKTRVEQLTPAQLWRAVDNDSRTELHWRIAIPVVLLVLALLAVPLAHISPRQGRFGKVGYALLVFVVYLNLLAFARAKLASGALPMVLNFWWVHAVFLVLALGLLYRRNRGFFPQAVGP